MEFTHADIETTEVLDVEMENNVDELTHAVSSDDEHIEHQGGFSFMGAEELSSAEEKTPPGFVTETWAVDENGRQLYARTEEELTARFLKTCKAETEKTIPFFATGDIFDTLRYYDNTLLSGLMWLRETQDGKGQRPGMINKGLEKLDYLLTKHAKSHGFTDEQTEAMVDDIIEILEIEEQDKFTTQFEDDPVKAASKWADEELFQKDFEDMAREPHSGSMVDEQKSREFVDKILDNMAPEFTFHATKPMPGYRHRNILDSLIWISGNVKRGTKGVTSLEFLTRHDRNTLISFSRESWDFWKKEWARRREIRANAQPRVENDPQPTLWEDIPLEVYEKDNHCSK
jgi:hypothetical protein